MEILVATLCDFAADYGGKLAVVGAFDTIVARELPAIHPQCAVALRFVFRKEDEGEHRVRLAFVDEDGRPIMPGLETAAEVAVADDICFCTRNFVLNLQHLRFEAAGSYAVDVTVDDRAVASIPLQVRQFEDHGAPG